MGTAFQDSLLEDTLAIGSNLSTHVNVFAPHTTLKQNPTPHNPKGIPQHQKRYS